MTSEGPQEARVTWTMRRPRVGLLTPYFAFFDDRFPRSFRARQESYAKTLATRLAHQGITVVYLGLCSTDQEARRQGTILAVSDLDAVVVAPTMAVPPAYVLPAIEACDKPVILWYDSRVEQFSHDFSEIDATEFSGLLGCVMVANVLRRTGRRFEVVSSTGQDDHLLASAIRGAAAASSLSAIRMGCIGAPISGYLDVALDDIAASSIGLTVVRIDAEQIARWVESASDSELDIVLVRLKRARLRMPRSRNEAVEQSLRVCVALSKAVSEYNLDALAINCHETWFRFNRRIGVQGCLAASLQSSEGVPVACTGDASTTFALTVMARLAGHAQYCEGYALGAKSGELILGSCGMGDPRLAQKPVGVVFNQLYSGVRGAGCGLRMPFPSGPATMVGFSPQTEHVASQFTWAFGELTGHSYRKLVGPNGTYRFGGSSPAESTLEWIRHAPAHHVALSRGDVALELKLFDAFTDLKLVRVA